MRRSGKRQDPRSVEPAKPAACLPARQAISPACGGILRRVAESLRAFGVREGDGIVAGVSGGPDSVCLLHALKTTAERFPIRLTVAHLDHRIRGSQSRADARFVEGLGREWKVPVMVGSADVGALAREGRISLQVAGREARYAFYMRVAALTQSRWIALGHTADDQAETILMRLFRGAGPQGLSAIPPRREMRDTDGTVRSVIRPLLHTRRDEILQYLKSNRVPFRVDPSNRARTYQRSRVRHEVIPLLTAWCGPHLVQSLCRAAELSAEEQRFIQDHAVEWLAHLRLPEPGPGLSVSRSRFLNLHAALRRAVLREAIRTVKGDLNAIGYDHIQAAVNLIRHGRTGSRISLPRVFVVVVSRDRFLIHGSGALPAGLQAVPVDMHGETDLPVLKASLRVSVRGKSVAADPRGLGVFDLSKAHPPFVVRGRRRGDYFCPSGMGGRKKKLQDFFVDEKIPRHERDRIPILCSSEGILWVIGRRFDDRFLAGPQTRKVMVVEFRPKGD